MLTSEEIKNTKQVNQEEEDIFEQNQIIQTPGQLIMKRFLRNKLAIFGVCIILAISLFSFVGPLFSPYGEYEIFYINQTKVGVSCYNHYFRSHSWEFPLWLGG